jgi:Na+/proline symporter
VLACKNVADGRKALVLSAVVIFPLFLIFLLAGAMLWVFYQTHPFKIPLPESRPGIKSNDFIYPIFMLTETPHVLKGLLIVAVLSAAMSSVSSALTSLASVSTMDFVKGYISKGRSEAYYLRFSKISTVFWAAALIYVAYVSRQVPFILDAAFKLRGLTSGALLGGLILALFWKNGRALPVIIGMTCSLAVMTWISPLIQTLPKLPRWLRLENQIAFPWYTTFGVLITLVVAFIASVFFGRSRQAEPGASAAERKTQSLAD